MGGWCCCFGFWDVDLFVCMFVCLKNPKLIWPDNTVFQLKCQDLAFVIQELEIYFHITNYYWSKIVIFVNTFLGCPHAQIPFYLYTISYK